MSDADLAVLEGIYRKLLRVTPERESAEIKLTLVLEIKRLRAALRFYSDPRHYDNDKTTSPEGRVTFRGPKIYFDKGEVAQKALTGGPDEIVLSKETQTPAN